ncbi:hypothetical protein D3C80_1588370 [compost metagenome]
MKKENIFLAVLATVVVGVLLYKKFSKANKLVPVDDTDYLDKNLILKKGSQGEEVRELQGLLKVATDGIFGPITESALLKQRGVKQISLNAW